jgi:hypothetical protein
VLGVWATVPYAKIQNDGGTITRAAQSERFIRPRATKGKRGKMFGGMGAFRKITGAEQFNRYRSPAQGQSYKAYSITIPRRRYLGNSPAVRQVVRQAIIDVLKAD